MLVQWLVAAAVFVILLALLPGLLRRLKPKPGKGGGGGLVIGLMMIFASVFDPAKAAAIEQLDRKKEIGDAEDGESGDKP